MATMNAAEVGAGSAKVTGAIWVAPKGTTLPTDATTALAGTYKLLGFTSDAGVTISENDNSQDLTLPLTPEEGRFTGNVYLLTSHQTFSSAGSFAWAFKAFGMGTIVGEETGGMNVCFGDILPYRLPVSGLVCSISYKRFWQYGADEKDIHGAIPHYAVPQAQAMDKALKLARRK